MPELKKPREIAAHLRTVILAGTHMVFVVDDQQWRLRLLDLWQQLLNDFGADAEELCYYGQTFYRDRLWRTHRLSFLTVDNRLAGRWVEVCRKCDATAFEAALAYEEDLATLMEEERWGCNVVCVLEDDAILREIVSGRLGADPQRN